MIWIRIKTAWLRFHTAYMLWQMRHGLRKAQKRKAATRKGTQG